MYQQAIAAAVPEIKMQLDAKERKEALSNMNLRMLKINQVERFT